MNPISNKKAFTLIELMVATVNMLIILIIFSNFMNITKQIYSRGLSRQFLEDAANILMSRIMEGSTEAGGVYRLSQGTSYCIGTGVSCVGAPSTAELHYWSSDNIERWYKLNATSNALIYHHPTTGNPQGADETIYTAPTGAVLSLFFWIPTVENNPETVVGTRITLTQNSTTGSTTTIINLRNHS